MNISKKQWWLGGESAPSEQPDSIDLTGATSIIAMGDSIMVGFNASNQATLSFIQLYKTAKGLASVNNTAISGAKVLHVFRAVKAVAITRSTTALFVSVGLNDITTENDNAVNRLQYKQGIRSLIGVYLASTKVPSGSASVTRSGTFVSNVDLTPYGFVYGIGSIPGNVAAFSNTINSYYEYSFTDTKIGFVFLASSGTDYSTLTVRIDGVIVETFDPNDYISGEYDSLGAKTFNAFHKTYFGLTNAAHTIRVTVNESKTGAVDYFYVPLPPASCCAMVFCEIPYFADSYYGNGHPSPNNRKATIIKSDLWSSYVEEIVDEFRALGYKASYFNTNDHYVRATGLDVDNIHPNDVGHDQIADGLILRTL